MSLARNLIRYKMPGLAQIVPVLAILMEVLWSYAWLVWISGWPALGWDRAPVNFISFALQSVVTWMLTRLAVKRAWPITTVRLVVLPASLLLLLLIIRLNLGGGYSIWDAAWVGYASKHVSEIIGSFFFGVYITWRGISASQQKFNFHDLYSKFLVGLGGMILLLVVWGFAKGYFNNTWSAIGIYIISYFGVSLLALAIANLETLRAELLQHQEALGAFSRRWLTLLVILVLAILGISIAISALFSTNIASMFVHGLGVFADWILTGITYLLFPVSVLVGGLLWVLRYIVSWLRGGAEPPKFDISSPSDLQKQVEGQGTLQIPVWALLLIKWGLLAILVAIAIFFLARTLRRFWQGKSEDDVEEVHATLWSWGLFRADLGGIWSWLFSWMRRKKKLLIPEALKEMEYDVKDGDESVKTYNVRQLYRALLWQGREVGSPRRESETPYEYQSRLNTQIPQVSDEVSSLTEAYIKERYGEVSLEEEKLTLLNRIWRSLRSRLKREEE